jgi:hypothetical protein
VLKNANPGFEVLAMRSYEDIIDGCAGAYVEDLDTEDLALIDSVVGILEEDDEKNGQRKATEWEFDTLIDEF